jgi:hypothetical protein
MIGFGGRLRWRQHKLFKLRAKLVRRKNRLSYKWLVSAAGTAREVFRIENLRFAQSMCGAQ